MKVVESKYIGYFKHYFYYREDLEKMSTKELVWVLRGLRRDESRELYRRDKNKWSDLETELEGCWLTFEWTDFHMSHAMIWMVKDILSHRPHVPKSKAERKAIRQKQAKFHIRIPKIA